VAEDWATIRERDRVAAQYSRPRKTRRFGRWLFFEADWALSLTIVARFDKPWTRELWKLDHRSTQEPNEVGRLYVTRWHPKTGRDRCWLVLEHDPRNRGDPVDRNPILAVSWKKHPPLREAARLLNERVVTTEAARRLGWEGKEVSE
jgi:hypothetical protein